MKNPWRRDPRPTARFPYNTPYSGTTVDSVRKAERIYRCVVHAIDPSRRLFCVNVNVSLKVTCHAFGALWRPEIKLLDDQNRASGSEAVEPSVILLVLLGNLPPRSSAQDPCHRAIVAPILISSLLLGPRAPAPSQFCQGVGAGPRFRQKISGLDLTGTRHP